MRRHIYIQGIFCLPCKGILNATCVSTSSQYKLHSTESSTSSLLLIKNGLLLWNLESYNSILFQALIALFFYRSTHIIQLSMPSIIKLHLLPTPSDQHVIISTAVPQSYMYHPPHPPCNSQPNKMKREVWLVKRMWPLPITSILLQSNFVF